MLSRQLWIVTLVFAFCLPALARLDKAREAERRFVQETFDEVEQALEGEDSQSRWQKLLRKLNPVNFAEGIYRKTHETMLDPEKKVTAKNVIFLGVISESIERLGGLALVPVTDGWSGILLMPFFDPVCWTFAISYKYLPGFAFATTWLRKTSTGAFVALWDQVHGEHLAQFFREQFFKEKDLSDGPWDLRLSRTENGSQVLEFFTTQNEKPFLQVKMRDAQHVEEVQVWPEEQTGEFEKVLKILHWNLRRAIRQNLKKSTWYGQSEKLDSARIIRFRAGTVPWGRQMQLRQCSEL